MSSSIPVNKENGEATTSLASKWLVIKRSYILNDTGALKKKIRHESRKEPFNQGTEARDGSNIVLQFRVPLKMD